MDNLGKCRINPEEKWESHYWSVRWGITYEVLVTAIKAVGDDARKIEAYLIEKDLIT